MSAEQHALLPPPDGAPGGRGLRRMRPRPLAPLPPHQAPAIYDAAGASAADDRPDLVRYWTILRRRWRSGLLVLLIVVSGVMAGLALRDPAYRATALLEIRRETTGAVAVDALFGEERLAANELETQIGILRSASLAERVVALLNRAAADGPAGALSLEQFREQLIISPKTGSRLVEVSYDSPDPRFSARAVNSVLDSYMQVRMEDAARRAEWLTGELRKLQDTLQTSEQRLQAYVRDHGLEILESGKGEAAQLVNDRLQSLHGALGRAQVERMAKQSAYEQALRQIAAGDLGGPVVENLSVRLADLRREHAKLAAVFHDEYPAVKALKTQIAAIEAELQDQHQLVANRVAREYHAAVRTEALLRQSLDAQNGLLQALGDNSAAYESLKRDVVSNQQLFGELNQKLKEVSISMALKAANVGVIDRATPPAVARGWSPATQLTLAVLVGLILAVGVVLVQEHFDTSIRTADDVSGYLGVPTVAAIPVARMGRVLPGGSRRLWRRIDQGGEPSAQLGEAFAALRTAVLLRTDDETRRTLLVTSACSSEGKTTVSINLALSLERLQHRVLLIDANMWNPCIQEALTLPDTRPGLVSYLSGTVDWRRCVRQAVRPNLDVIAGGRPPRSPSDLLGSPRMATLLAEAAREYDYVIMDSPALLPSPADVRTLAALVDGVLFTVRHGSTPRDAASFALSHLPGVIGVVLNRAGTDDIFIADAWPSDLPPGVAPPSTRA